jgi:dCMP deaminase
MANLRANDDEEHAANLASRPSYESIYLRHALQWAARSTCRRYGVGSVITSEDFCYTFGVGYNGNAAGLSNDCDLVGDAAVGNCGCVHSEVNAVLKCRAKKNEPKIFFCTHQPCVACAKLIINLGGVKEVVYLEPYRIPTSLELFEKTNIKTRQVSI